MKCLFVLLFITILPFTCANAQQYEQRHQATIKELILMKLDSINQVYFTRLRPRDKFDARRTLNQAVDLLEQMDDRLRDREHLLAERERILAEKERILMDRDKNHDRNTGRYNDEDQKQFQNNDRYNDKNQNQNRDSRRDNVGPAPMSFTEFDQLISSIEHASFDQDKKKIVRAVVVNKYFMVDQVVKIASKFSFDNDRLEAIELLYPRILDLDKNYLLYNCFSFSDSKNKLEKFINNYNTGK